MTVPVWMLLGFAAWTVLLLLSTVGVYRWSRILTGRVPIRDFRADQVEGEDWYRRSMRAHANCIENLPVVWSYCACTLRCRRRRLHCKYPFHKRSSCPRHTIFGARVSCADQYYGSCALRILSCPAHQLSCAYRHGRPSCMAFIVTYNELRWACITSRV